MIVEWIPRDIALALAVLALLAVGIVVERHYVSRVTALTNGIAVVVHVLTVPSQNEFTYLYADAAFIIGLVGFVFYIFRASTGWLYNDVTFFLFSSLNVGLVIAFPAELWWLAILLGVVGQAIIVRIYGDESAYFGGDPFPASVIKSKVEAEIDRQKRLQVLRDRGHL